MTCSEFQPTALATRAVGCGFPASFNQLKGFSMTRFLKKYGAAGAALVAATSARAELPAAVLTAIDEAGTDLTTAATAVILALIAFWALRKVGQKMGWW